MYLPMFFACFFCRPDYRFLKWVNCFLYFVALFNFFGNLSNVFFRRLYYLFQK